MSIQRFESSARMSQAVVANGFVFLAGQVATDPSADVEGQTRQVLAEIDRLLALVGTSKQRILSATIYLADVASFAAMNRAWEAWVPADAKPARAKRLRHRLRHFGLRADDFRLHLLHARFHLLLHRDRRRTPDFRLRLRDALVRLRLRFLQFRADVLTHVHVRNVDR